MMNFQNVDRDESVSALFDGENLPEKNFDLTHEEKEHFENWSLIGSALRNELPQKVNLDFADNLMARIHNENIRPDIIDQTEAVKTDCIPAGGFKNVFKKVAFTVAQMAVAASVAAVTIIGYQTYNADVSSTSEIAASAAVANLGAANLASFQTNRGSAANDIKLESTQDNAKNAQVNDLELKKQQRLELERINNYIRGYVIDTASK